MDLGQECQTNGTEYVPIGRKKKKEKMSTNDDDEEYVDLSDDEIIIEDDDDDLSDLYPGKFSSTIEIYIFTCFYS